MRVRATLITTGIAALALAGLAVPAQAAAWEPHSRYGSYRACVDAGQMYVRENYDEYKCTDGPGYYQLWLR
ncbi:hypothetical protein [Nonomuraea solani]|nr:hypothetical protein [Nonomuraea solani]